MLRFVVAIFDNAEADVIVRPEPLLVVEHGHGIGAHDGAVLVGGGCSTAVAFGIVVQTAADCFLRLKCGSAPPKVIASRANAQILMKLQARLLIKSCRCHPTRRDSDRNRAKADRNPSACIDSASRG